MSLSYLQNISIYFNSGKYKLSIRSFLEYFYTIIFAHVVFYIPQKDFWCMRNVRKIFPALNLTVICIMPFICNNTTFSISVSFLTELLFLHRTFSFKHNITDDDEGKKKLFTEKWNTILQNL